MSDCLNMICLIDPEGKENIRINFVSPQSMEEGNCAHASIYIIYNAFFVCIPQ